ncbi:hypothetical protein TNCV_4469871 [Trichonephila clavipes]|nr:hypothetical protein TNCV_4469871 [Trichonephila clavipes]
MSDFSDCMDFSPSRHLQVAACEKLTDTVTGISALHQSLQEKESLRSPGPRNSYTELYRMNAQAMARKKEEMQMSPSLLLLHFRCHALFPQPKKQHHEHRRTRGLKAAGAAYVPHPQKPSECHLGLLEDPLGHFSHWISNHHICHL